MGKTQYVGQAAEVLAYRYLEKQGLRLVTRNFYCRMGEIDLIMQDGDYLVFIEVRYRNTTAFGNGLESVSYTKQKKLLKAAHYYLLQNNLYEKAACRFDVIAISSLHSEQNIEWVKNAF